MVFVAALFMALTFSVHANEVDKLIRDLAGNNESARVTARQLLPRHGMDAVPALIDLLDHDQQPVWRVAHKVLRDIIHGGPVGISDHDRTHISALLVNEIDESKPDVTRRVIELLSHSAPEGFDLSRVGDLLKNEDLRMDARGALELAGTNQAAAALALPSTDDVEFTVAVVDSLRTIGGPTARSMLKKHASDRNVRVRIAAIRGLIQYGAIELADTSTKALNDARANGDDAVIHDAHDVYLRVADAIANAGGNWEVAIAMYTNVLDSTDSGVWRGAALAGLGRFGDSSAVATILAAADKHGANLEPQALMALGVMHGRESYKAMLAEFDDASPTMKYGMLSLFGRTGDAIFIDTLLANANGDDPALKATAIEGLMLGEYPQGAEVVSAYAEAQPEGDARKYARRAIKLYAEALSNAGASAAAGRTYVAIHRIAETEADKAIALEGIRRHPTAEGLNVIMADIDMDNLGELSLDTLISLAEALHGAEKIAERDKVLNAVVANMKGTAEVQSVADRIGGHAAFAPLSSRMGFVRKWHIAGPFASETPFEKNPVNAPNIDLGASYGEVEWKPVETSHPWAMVNLMGDLGAIESASAFAHAAVNIAEATEGHIRAGSDDGIRIWLNGELVHTNAIDRGVVMDADTAAVKFKQGKNEIVAEISQNFGGWAYTMRLTGADGAPLAFSQE